jgi:hypothetical protein
MRRLLPCASLLALLFAAAVPARAEMWCADALWVHEWGVQVFGRDGAEQAVELPSYFHRQGPQNAGPNGPPVRELPPDGGMRELPIVHFYSTGTWSDQTIPVGLEVGFTQGRARAWFPQVDVLRSAQDANAGPARDTRRRIVTARNALSVLGARGSIPADPTRQLEWTRLELTRQPMHAAPRTSSPWVRDLRSFDALWVNHGSESERFVFYDATTSERAQISIARGDQYRADRRHYVMTNRSPHAVHDVFVVHRDGNDVFVFFTGQIPANASAGFVLEEHRVAANALARETRERLSTALTDAQDPAPPAQYRWGSDNCVMQRDPAQPTETAQGHRLYRHEVDAILGVWGARFFDAQGTTIVYREDVEHLSSMMPISVYTDMYRFVVLRRAGLAVWENVQLP